MTKWRVKWDTHYLGRLYRQGDVIEAEGRPVLDHLLDERHWQLHLEEVKPEPPVRPAGKVVPMKKPAA